MLHAMVQCTKYVVHEEDTVLAGTCQTPCSRATRWSGRAMGGLGRETKRLDRQRLGVSSGRLVRDVTF